MIYDAEKLDQYLSDHSLICNGTTLQITNDGTGQGAEIVAWDEEAHGAQPTPEEIAIYSPSPLPALGAALRNREISAANTITNLKRDAAAYLMAGGMSAPDAFVAGSAFVVAFAAHIQAFILAGGNPIAGQALIDAVVANPPEWWDENLLGIFQAALL